MHPNKVRNLIPSFAMEMGRPVDEVQAVISFYYKKVRQSVSALNSVNVHLENLGNFYVKEKALDKYIEKCSTIVELLSNNTFKEYSSKIDYRTKLEMSKAMKELINQERLRRRVVIDKRFNNESEK